MPQKKSLGTQADVGLIHQAVEFSRRGLGTSSGKTEHHKLLLHMIAGIPAADSGFHHYDRRQASPLSLPPHCITTAA